MGNNWHMTKKQEGCKLSGFPISIFIDPNGNVTITSLISSLVSVAHALDPDELRIKGFYETLKGGKDVTLYNYKNKTG